MADKGIHFKDELFEELVNSKFIDAPVEEEEAPQDSQTVEKKPSTPSVVPHNVLLRIELVGMVMFKAKMAQQWLENAFGDIIEKQRMAVQKVQEYKEKASEKLREFNEVREQYRNRSLSKLIVFLWRLRKIIRIIKNVIEIGNKIIETIQVFKEPQMSVSMYTGALLFDEETRQDVFGSIWEKVQENIVNIIRDVVGVIIVPVSVRLYQFMKEMFFAILEFVAALIISLIPGSGAAMKAIKKGVDIYQKAKLARGALGVFSATDAVGDLLTEFSKYDTTREVLGLMEGKPLSVNTKHMLQKNAVKVMLPFALSGSAPRKLRQGVSLVADAKVIVSDSAEMLGEMQEIVGGFLSQFQKGKNLDTEVSLMTSNLMSMSLKEQEELALSFKSDMSSYTDPLVVEKVDYKLDEKSKTMTVNVPGYQTYSLWARTLFVVYKTMLFAFPQFFVNKMMSSVTFFNEKGSKIEQNPNNNTAKDFIKGANGDFRIENVTKSERFIKLSQLLRTNGKIYGVSIEAKQGEQTFQLTVKEGENGETIIDPRNEKLTLDLKDKSLFSSQLSDKNKGAAASLFNVKSSHITLCRMLKSMCAAINSCCSKEARDKKFMETGSN